jgi:glycosyltransferase involved in cell wall biosynthesis
VRIGVFGNTNNYPLLLTIALRRLGHNAVLAVNRAESLHRPESRFPEFARGYPDWILDCSGIPEEDFVAAHSRIESVLNFLAHGSDALILNDLGPALHAFCPLPSMALLTGSDVSYFADPRMPALRMRDADDAWRNSVAGRFVERHWEAFVMRQRAGIRAASVVSAPVTGLVPVIDALLDGIGVEPARRDFMYLANTEGAPARPRQDAGRLRVVNGARLNWKRPLPDGYSSQDHKGSDVLLRGFAGFVDAGGDAELTLFRKGLHVAETEALVRELGIEAHVVWRAECSAADFSSIVREADVVCDQLGDAFPGMVALDAMAMGSPVIANFRPDLTGTLFPRGVPACQASTPEEVRAHLQALADADRRDRVGAEARVFAQEHLSPRANAEKYLRRLGLAA